MQKNTYGRKYMYSEIYVQNICSETEAKFVYRIIRAHVESEQGLSDCH